jgi:Complex 1 protein (LYR family)
MAARLTRKAKHSGLQKRVLQLYRRFLVNIRTKSELSAEQKSDMQSMIRDRFRQDAQAVPQTNFFRIEYLLRRGEKQLKLIQMPGFRSVSVTTPNNNTS